jgi:hypothetical protein
VAYTVLANASNCMDACSLRSRQSSDDAAAPDAHCCETVGKTLKPYATEKGVTSKRLRCSQCGRRRCSATVRPETKRDG